MTASQKYLELGYRIARERKRQQDHEITACIEVFKRDFGELANHWVEAAKTEGINLSYALKVRSDLWISHGGTGYATKERKYPIFLAKRGLIPFWGPRSEFEIVASKNPHSIQKMIATAFMDLLEPTEKSAVEFHLAQS